MIRDSHLPTSECFSISRIVQTSWSNARLHGIILRNRGLPASEELAKKCDVWGWNAIPDRSPILTKRDSNLDSPLKYFYGLQDSSLRTDHTTTTTPGWIVQTIFHITLSKDEKLGGWVLFFSETGIRGPFLEDQRHFVLLSSASPTYMSYKPSKGVASPSHNNLPYTVLGIFPVESNSLAYFHIQLCHTELSSFCPFCLWPGCLRNRKPILWLHNITVVFSYRSKWGI